MKNTISTLIAFKTHVSDEEETNDNTLSSPSTSFEANDGEDEEIPESERKDGYTVFGVWI